MQIYRLSSVETYHFQMFLTRNLKHSSMKSARPIPGPTPVSEKETYFKGTGTSTVVYAYCFS